ncbi:MAG: efflux RND transporter periplasmic adaptor subunit, partial [Actinobacteria bacterium]
FDADEGSLLKYDRLARLGQRRSSRDFKNPVHVALANEEGFPHDGVMDFVDNQLDRGTGTIIGRALLPNPDLSLIPGLFARLRLPGSGEYRAILVPDEAIGSDQSQKFVFVVDGESKAEYRAVKIGPLVDGLRVVREGVTPDEWVVVAGLQRIRPGIKVDAQRETIPPPATVATADGITSTTEPSPDRRP